MCDEKVRSRDGWGRESEQVAEDGTDWVEVRRRTRRRPVEEGDEDEGEESCRTVQIFVKMDGSKAFPMEVSPSDKVSDVVRWIQRSVRSSSRDVHGTSGGRVFLRS